MEIEKYMDLYKQHSPEEFFNWLSKGRTMEVRFLSNYKGEKFKDWNLIRILGQEFGLEQRYNSLYINNYSELKKILLYKIDKFPLTRLYNIFIGVNPKRKIQLKGNNGLLYKSFYGGIAGTSHIQTILADIEHIGEREGNATEEMLEDCIQGALYLVKLLRITDYYINISGNGVHLWIAMYPAIELPIPSFREVTIKGKDTVKYNLKEEPINTFIKTYNRFIVKLDKNIKQYSPKLKVDDGAKDLSRIARPPGSWNVKIGKTARAVGTVAKDNQFNIYINKQFTAAKPLLNKKSQDYKRIKSQSKHHRYTALNIREVPLYKLMVSQLLPSTLSRNHFLEQSFARILRDNEIEEAEVGDVIGEIDEVQQKSIQIDPDYLDDPEPFNPETINAYCYKCKIDFVYKILEDVADVQDGFITDSHYDNLNSYTEKTIKEMIIPFDESVKIPDSYFDLKCLVRNLIDKYERSSVFFTLKYLLAEEWDYLHRNKIIHSLINKTRRKKCI